MQIQIRATLSENLHFEIGEQKALISCVLSPT